MTHPFFQKSRASFISLMSNKVKKEGGINCAQGIPGFSPPSKLLSLLGESAGKPFHQYAPGRGLEKLKERICNSVLKESSPKNIIITNGATEAVSLVYQYISMLKPKTTALVFDPPYESHRYLPLLHGHNLISFSRKKSEAPDFNRLEKIFVEKNITMAFLASPGNPHGLIWSSDEISTLINLCKKHNIFLILDAVYREIYFDLKPSYPFSIFHPGVFYVDSFSKMLSVTGWRIGFIHAHESHISALANIHDYTGLSTASILQHVISEYLKNPGNIKTYTERIRKKSGNSFKAAADILKKAGCFIPPTHGGYFIWAKLPPPYYDGVEFAEKLFAEEAVAVVPGIHFSPEANQFIRINIAQETDEIIEAACRISSFITT
ncbi:MAG: pyridoxal phosphate-dependent aminotransferase [bacterium]